MFLVLASEKDLPTRANVQPKFVVPSDSSAPHGERPKGATHISFSIACCSFLLAAVWYRSRGWCFG